MKLTAYDTETNGLQRHLHDMFAYSTCDDDWWLDVVRLDGKDNSSPRKSLNQLKMLFSERGIKNHEFIMHNAKFDIGMTENAVGRKFAEGLKFHDTYMQAHVLQNNHHGHGLKNLAWEMFGVPQDDETAIKDYIKGPDDEIDYSLVPANLMHAYQERDVERTMLLHQSMYPQIQANKQWLECYESELALSVVTLRMENRGVMINRERTFELQQDLAKRSEEIIRSTVPKYGKRMNFGNDSVVREILYDDLKMPVSHTTKTGKPSVDKGALAAMRLSNPHSVLDSIQEYKSLFRGVTILQSYLDFADADDIIHTDLKTCGAATGRQSSSKPNMQNVSSEEKLLNPFPIPARLCFRPRPGYVHFHIDYSGIQFKIAVGESGDEKLLEWANDGTDLHVEGVSRLLGNVWKNANADERKVLRGAGKNANFCSMFGGSKIKVFAAVGAPVNEACWKDYKEAFGALSDSSRNMVSEARRTGYTETCFGRRLYIPRHKPYIATNYKIQGGEAGVVKRAQVRAAHKLLELTGGEAQIILPIHDEIIIEFPRKMLSEAPYVLSEVRKVMIDFPMVNVPLEIDIEVATRDWAHKHKYDLDEAIA